MIDRERLLNLLGKLCRIDSAPRRERAIADRMRAELETLGFTVEEDGAAAAVGGECGNLIARLPGRRPGAGPILLSAHMDRVPNGTGVRPVRRADRLASDGSTVLGADDAAGLAVIIEAVRAAQERQIPLPPLEVVLTVCEEVGLLGARALDFSQLRSRMGFVLDAEGLVGGLVVEAPSSARITATFTGRPAHAGVAPEKGISAIQMAARAIDRMPLGRIDDETTATVGLIKGGSALNVIPELCEMTAGARSRNDSKLEAQLQRMLTAMDEAAAAFGGRVAYKVERMYGGYRLETDHPAVVRAAAAVRAAGLTPSFKASGGGSDANIFNNNGIPTVALCVGYEKIHSVEETMPYAQLYRLAGVTLALLSGNGAY